MSMASTTESLFCYFERFIPFPNLEWMPFSRFDYFREHRFVFFPCCFFEPRFQVTKFSPLTLFVAEGDLELLICPPLPPKSQDYRNVQPHQVLALVLNSLLILLQYIFLWMLLFLPLLFPFQVLAASLKPDLVCIFIAMNKHQGQKQHGRDGGNFILFVCVTVRHLIAEVSLGRSSSRCHKEMLFAGLLQLVHSQAAFSSSPSSFIPVCVHMLFKCLSV